MENLIHEDSIEWGQGLVMFRCTKCFNQFPPERVNTDEKGFVRCPICDGYVRQMKADGDLYDTYV